MVFDLWQLVIAAGVLLVGFIGLLLTLLQMYNTRNKELEARHERLVTRHHDHIKEVADKYAKKVYVNERVESLERHVIASIDGLEKQVISSLAGIKELIEARVK